MTLGTKGFNNVCLGCHSPGGDAYAQKKPFILNDPSNFFGNNTTARNGSQSSHNWSAPETNPAAGASRPANFYLNNRTFLLGQVTCIRCHSIHNSPNTPNTSMPYLRVKNDADQLCFECHSQRNKRDHTTGTHPVNFGYTSATSKVKLAPGEYNKVPVNANPSNPSSNLNAYLNKGVLLCSSCHNIHRGDSSSASYDSYTSVMIKQPSKREGLGALLRTDLRGSTVTSVNICTNCHKSADDPANTLARVKNHNGTTKQQNIQCADCHGGHVDTGDGSIPNVYLIRRYMNVSSATGGYPPVRNKKVLFQYTSAANKNYNKDAYGVCLACHSPLPGTITEHTSTNAALCNTCHTHKMGFSADCTACHGFPPRQNVAGGTPNSGYAAGYINAGVVNESLSPHQSHALGSGGYYAFACAQCHKGNNHNSATPSYQDVFIDKTGIIAGTAASYNKTSRRCSSVYCHSNGAPRGGFAVYTSEVWGNNINSIIGLSGAARCGSCHSATPATNAHSKHITTMSYGCVICHSTTVSGNTTLLAAARSNGGTHVNGVKEVVFSSYTAAQGATWDNVGGQCSNLYCHSQGTTNISPYIAPIAPALWIASYPADCSGCHGGDTASASPIATGKHSAHINSNPVANPSLGLGNGLGCEECHAKTVSSSRVVSNAAKHLNRLKDYSGARAGRNANCVNFYCHSNGNPASLNYKTVSWSGGSLGCNGCHGSETVNVDFPTSAAGAPNYKSGGAGSATANSHNKHVPGSNITDTTGCANCHVKTVDPAIPSKFKDYSAVKYHLNGAPNVYFKPLDGKTGSFNGSSCSATYCHGTVASPAWGLNDATTPLSCDKCHSAANAGSWAASSAHKLHWETTALPSKFTNYSGNVSSTTQYRFTCSSCHGGSASHANGPADPGKRAAQVYFGFSSAGKSPAYVNGATAPFSNDNGFNWTNGSSSCTNTYCHSDGKGGAGKTAVAWSTTANSASATTRCAACHDNPSTTTPPAASTTLSGKHGNHLLPAVNGNLGAGNGLGCAECHAKTVNSNTNISNRSKHINKFVDYSGSEAGKTYNSVTHQCSAVYCHSNGNKNSVVFQIMTGGKVWTGAATLACNGCHGRDANPDFPTSATGAPNYKSGGAGAATANSHNKHVPGANITDTTGCANCHVQTVNATVPNQFKDYSAAKYHINRTADVIFKSLDGKTGSFNGSSCSATYCHGTVASPAWGLNDSTTPLSCDKCHSAANSGYWGGKTAHKVHWESIVLPGKYVNYSGNVSSTTQYRFTCSSCHGSPASHANGPAEAGKRAAQVYFGFSSAGKSPNYLSGVLQGNDNGFNWTDGSSNNCNNTYCHSNGAGAPANRMVNWSTSSHSASANVRCTACHGYTGASGNPLTTGKHGAHVNLYSFSCAECHNGASSTGTSITNNSLHINKKKDVAWGGFNSGANAYTGQNCTNLYCHSKGKVALSNYSAPNTTANWNSILASGCSGCHGGGDTSATPISSGSHTKHIAGNACGRCHNVTASANYATYTTILSAGYSTYHVNKQVDVALDPTAYTGTPTYNGLTATVATPFTKTPGTGVFGACTNITCHSDGSGIWKGTPVGGATPKWGVAGAGCSACHGNNNFPATDFRKAFPLYTSYATASTRKPNAHDQHADFRAVNSGPECAHCHNSVTTTNTTITGAGHNNGAYDLSAGKTYNDPDTWNGTAAVTLTPTLKRKADAPQVSSCANVSCHPAGLNTTTGLAATKATSSVTWDNRYKCVNCHSINLKNNTGYHHGMSNYTSVAILNYPTAIPGDIGATANDISRRCVMCHVDHDIFSPMLNTNNTIYGSAGNLRSDIAVSPTAAAGYANTDFSKTGAGGICVSCHKNELFKDVGNVKVINEANSTKTPAIVLNNYTGSAHEYFVSSNMKRDNKAFNASCSKCHNSRKGEVSAFSSMTTATHESPVRRIYASLGGNLTDGVDALFCYRCHSNATDAIGGTKKPVDGKDYYNVAAMSGPAEDIFTVFNKTNKHNVANAAYAGKHKTSPTDETLAYIAANKHVSCNDCHDPHSAKSGKHSLKTNLVSAVLKSVPGVDVTTWPANWIVPATTAYNTTQTGVMPNATKEYQICFKCHTGANTSLAAWDATWTDLALEFNPNNKSYHPVVVTASATTKLAAGQMTAAWNSVGAQTMYCSDCHGNDAAAPAAQGPHGSTVSHILAGPNTKWPESSPGVLYQTGSGTTAANLTGLFCLNCHPMRVSAIAKATWYNNAHTEHDGVQVSNVACIRCHILVPHGGKVSRLIATNTAGLPTRYAYAGNKANVYVTQYMKAATPTGYGSGNCNTSCGGHGTVGTPETW